MIKSRVSVVVCASYEKEQVYRAVKCGIDALGGIGRFVAPDERILVKPNFLYPSEAEKAITTHPAVIGAVLRVLCEAGYGRVQVGDSPANGTCRAALGKLALGEDELYGAAIADMNEEVTVPVPNGRAAKELHLVREATETDAIIGVCKMKTHALERITGAVKNMYGLICGKRKAAGHVKYPTAYAFANMLADIHSVTPQRLHVMDAVTAMEGNGPASGNAVNMNLILISPDPVAIDTVFCRLVQLSPSLVPTNIAGSLAGLGTADADEIEVLLCENGTVRSASVAETVEAYGNPKFDVVRGGEKLKTVLGLWSFLTGGSRRPVIDPEKCVRCGICVDH